MLGQWGEDGPAFKRPGNFFCDTAKNGHWRANMGSLYELTDPNTSVISQLFPYSDT